jgi:hypothetical protein
LVVVFFAGATFLADPVAFFTAFLATPVVFLAAAFAGPVVFFAGDFLAVAFFVTATRGLPFHTSRRSAGLHLA